MQPDRLAGLATPLRLLQVGCYVPCQSCELAPVDRVFTRLGAQDGGAGRGGAANWWGKA